MDAITFLEILRDSDFTARSYSGRGMYGRRCVAVDAGPGEDDLGDSDLPALGAFAARAARDLGGDDLADDLADLLASGTRVDSMGRGIVVYWPSVEWPDGTPEPRREDW